MPEKPHNKMEIIEFLQRTEQKNIKSFIGVKVKQKLNDYEKRLKERQEMLRNILEFENMQSDEELVLLLNERLEEQFRRRLEWINTKSLERQRAEEELLKLKKQQLELENCEEFRHKQSRQLLLETKEAQLYQIQEKKLKQQKEKLLDKMWLEAVERLNQEKEHLEIYEQKLQKVIARANQQKNQEIYDNNLKLQQIENEQFRKDSEEENNRVLRLDLKSQKEEKLREVLTNTRHNELLKSQIASNIMNKRLEEHESLEEYLDLKHREDNQILIELDQAEREKVRNNEWHKCYLENCLKEKQEKHNEDIEYEHMYLNTGCVLQQSQKRPYCRNAR